MAERRTNAEPGDVVELKDKESGFTDPETGFDISRDQQLELGDRIGQATHQAVLTGGLLIVSGGKAKTKAAADTKAEDQAIADAADAATRPAAVAVLEEPKSKKK
jgi:hypothetical protein